jgi:phosphoribosylglycinamide formyltransferase-1
MTFRFGWFSTGRDEAARQLMQVIWEKINEGFIPGEISFVFCNRQRGEGKQSDLLLDLADGLGLKVITFSSKFFKPDLAKRNLERWRSEYHNEVMERIAQYSHGIIVLAGYMLIVSPQMCRLHMMINLHPALPNGPTGAWEEVIEELIRQKADATGMMIHLVTENLDRGPVIAYSSFSLQEEDFVPLWRERLSERGPLFWRIRNEGVRREIPLLVLTMKKLAEGEITIKDGKMMDSSGKDRGALDLTQEVEDYLQT